MKEVYSIAFCTSSERDAIKEFKDNVFCFSTLKKARGFLGNNDPIDHDFLDSIITKYREGDIIELYEYRSKLVAITKTKLNERFEFLDDKSI